MPIAQRSRMSEPTKRNVRPYRSAFLATIATVAGMLAHACGGNVTGSNGNNGAGGSSGMGGAGTGGTAIDGGGTGGNPGNCPSVLPQDARGCDEEGRSCTYRACHLDVTGEMFPCADATSSCCGTS